MDTTRSAFDALPSPIGIAANGVWLYANPALVTLLGCNVVGRTMIDVVSPAERAAVASHDERRSGVHSMRWQRHDGSTVLVEVAMRPITFDEQSCVVVAVTDISARELLIARLGQSEESLRALLDASPDAMFVHGEAEREDDVMWANPAMVRMLGYDDASELIGRRSIDTFVHPDDRATLTAYRQRLQTGGGSTDLEVRWITRDGHTLYMHGTRRRVRFADAQAVLVIARDRTAELNRERERAESEAALRDSEARYRLLFDGSPHPICLFDAETFQYVAVNEKMLEAYGYSRDEFLRMTVMDVKLPEDVPTMKRGIAAAPVGKQAHVGIVRHRRKDGTLIDIDVTSHQMHVDGRKCSLAIGIDVTDRRRIEEQLRQAQKMEAIGQLAGGVAHDFNNLLAVILTTTGMVREDLGDSHPVAKDVAEIEAAAERGAALTRQLLAFSRKQPHTPSTLVLRPIVEGVATLLRRLLPESIELTSTLSSTGQIEADAGQLEQVIMNLVVNARDAMPDGGKLTIETANVELDNVDAACIGVAPGPYVALAVTDTGVGMDDATKRHIFEPFFTTKEVGRGTGLGLATVFGIVKQNNGGIGVYSEVGRGSTFRVYLPRIDKTRTTQDLTRATPDPAGGTESILVVEDNAQLRAVINRKLRALGYRTIEAQDATSAYAALASMTGGVDLLLTDLVMPGIDGRTLASKLLREHPALRVLFMSGYSEHAAIRTAALGANDHFIEKPFTANDLSVAIRRALQPKPVLRNRL